MRLLREAAYLGAAIALAGAWYALLLIPWGTRKMLLADPGPRLIVLCAIGLFFAITFRRWAARSFSMERGAAMAILIPIVGAVLFAVALTVQEWTSRSDPSAIGLVFTVIWTLVYVLGGAFYIVLPMSVITVFLMRMLAVALWPLPRVAEGEEFWW